jgi:hypothetical protein
VHDGVGDGAIPEATMPLVQRLLAGDHGPSSIVAIIEHFQQIARRGIGQRNKTEVIDNQQLDAAPLFQQRRAPLHVRMVGKHLHQPGQTEAAHGEVGAAGRVYRAAAT